MPREAQFNIEEKLGQALHLFWRQGYNATSMSDIKSELELNPGSIYSAFGSKRELYIKSLEMYQANVENLFKRLSENPSPKARILALFERILDEIKSGTECTGCFMLNATLEVAPHDREVQLIADKANQRMVHFFREEILKAQAAGEVPKSVNPESVSEMLILLLYGLRVRVRSRPPIEEMENAVARVRSLLSA